MFEIKMTIEIPGLPEALNALAGSIGGQAGIVTFGTATAPKAVDIPVAPAVNPTTAPAPAQNAPISPTAAPTPAPAPVQTAPVAPAEKSYTLDELSHAGAALIDQGKMPQLCELLRRYGVQAVTQLPKEAYVPFAGELKALGAQL